MERIEPCTCFSFDDQARRLRIGVKLPGVKEKDVTLEMENDNLLCPGRWNQTKPGSNLKANV